VNLNPDESEKNRYERTKPMFEVNLQRICFFASILTRFYAPNPFSNDQ